MSTYILCVCVAVLVPALDHLTKYLVRTFMDVGDSIPIIKNFFHITYILNDGMAFGSMGGKWRWVFMTVTPLALTAVAVYLLKNIRKLDKLSAVSLSMIFAGGLSNMVDRIFFIHLDPASTGLFDGRVIDFLDFNGIWDAVFNVADSAVVVGVFLFMGRYAYDTFREYRNRKALKHVVPEMPASENSSEPHGSLGGEQEQSPECSQETNGAQFSVAQEKNDGQTGEKNRPSF